MIETSTQNQPNTIESSELPIQANLPSRRDFMDKLQKYLYLLAAGGGLVLSGAVIRDNEILRAANAINLRLTSHNDFPEAIVKAYSLIPEHWPTCAILITRDGSPRFLRYCGKDLLLVSESEKIAMQEKVEAFNTGQVPKSSTFEVDQYFEKIAEKKASSAADCDVKVSQGSGFLVTIDNDTVFISNRHVVENYRRGLELISIQMSKADLAAHLVEVIQTPIGKALPPCTTIHENISDHELVGKKVSILIAGAENPLEIMGEVFQYEILKGEELEHKQLAVWVSLDSIRGPQYVPGGSGSPAFLADNPYMAVAVVKSIRSSAYVSSKAYPDGKDGLLIDLEGPEALQELASDWKLRNAEMLRLKAHKIEL